MKRKVETLEGVESKKCALIRRTLEGYPEGLTPKLISAKTGVNVNTVKSLLPKMAGVKKILRGLYKVVNEGDGTVVSGGDLFSWNFHNLIFNCGKDVGCFEFDLSLVKLFFDGVLCRVSSDYPLNVSSIVVVAKLVSLSVSVPVSDLKISSVEFNRDFKNLRLDGASSISVDNLVSQFKVYQKRRVLRVEHKTKVPIGVQTVVDMLVDSPDSVELHDKLNKQSELIGRLVSVTRRNTDALLKLSSGGVFK